MKKLEKVRTVTNDKGEVEYYWLRTLDTWNFNMVLGIAESGGVFTGSTVDSFEVYKVGVRPMCRINYLKKDMSKRKKEIIKIEN